MSMDTTLEASKENGKRERNFESESPEPPTKTVKNEHGSASSAGGNAHTNDDNVDVDSNAKPSSETDELAVKDQETEDIDSKKGSDTVSPSVGATEGTNGVSDSFAINREGHDESNKGAAGETESTSAPVKKQSLESSKTTKQQASLMSASTNSPKQPTNDPRKGGSAITSVTSTSSSVNQSSNFRSQNQNQQHSGNSNNANQIVEEKGEVSSLYVGRVIGKGGEMIRDLQARSGARIDVDQNVPPGHPRVITYKGTRETVDFAKQLVAILSREGASENDLPLGHASLKHLIIPAQSVGKVIGRGGEMIRELQSRSQAKIQIDHSGRSGQPPPDQKLVTITGTKEAVAKGTEMVNFLVANPLMDAQQALNMLIEDKTRTGLPWGSGPPYPNLPNQGINMTSNSSQQTFGGSSGGGGSFHHNNQFHAQPPMGYPNAGMPGVGGMMAHQPPMAQNFGHGMGMGHGIGGREIEVIYAAKQYMGRIIGGKGVTVNDLQRRSACEIQINQDVPPGQDCEITLKGTRPAIEAAKQMIKDIIEIGPQHPYAGGADTYGSSVGSGVYNHNQLSHVGLQHPQMVQPTHVMPPPQQHHTHHQQHIQQNQFGFQQAAYDQPQYGQAISFNNAQQGVPAAATSAPTFIQPSGFGQPAMSPSGYVGATATGYGQPQQQPPQAFGGYPPQQQIGATSVPPYHQQQHQPHQPKQQGPPPTMQQAAPAIAPWKTATAPDGQVYYYNERTGQTQWDKPVGMP